MQWLSEFQVVYSQYEDDLGAVDKLIHVTY